MKVSDLAAIIALVQTVDVDRPVSLPTRGAGVDPRKVVRPGKRLRNWFRKGDREFTGPSLRGFVRRLAAEHPASDFGDLARRWLASKGARL